MRILKPSAPPLASANDVLVSVPANRRANVASYRETRGDRTDAQDCRRLGTHAAPSELPTSGSVIRNELRMRPSRRGVSHRARCSGDPYLINTSMFPVSAVDHGV